LPHLVQTAAQAGSSQSARPFLFPAVAAADPELVRETGRVVDQVARKHGFR